MSSDRDTGKSEKDTPELTYDQRIERTRMFFSPENYPIDEPFQEKKVLENVEFYYGEYLLKRRGGPRVDYHHGGFEERIREVYRLCYNAEQDVSVIYDFVSFYHYLVFNTPWLDELVNENPAFGDPSNGSRYNMLLRALASGFRRAANNDPRIKKGVRLGKWELGKMAIAGFQAEISKLYKSVSWSEATAEDRKRRASEKVEEFIQKFPQLKPVREPLIDHLYHKRSRKAAVLMAHKLVNLPTRKLESKFLV